MGNHPVRRNGIRRSRLVPQYYSLSSSQPSAGDALIDESGDQHTAEDGARLQFGEPGEPWSTDQWSPAWS
ncbi:hypothetical protein [Streptomyces bluensis]|uniref:Uncharacterized protein n=1 Tax=Streptomyces bluensis TaxID=33897 RepID=A0ABW6UT22_9ACTN